MTMPSKRKVTIEDLGEFRWMVSRNSFTVEPINNPGNLLCISSIENSVWPPRYVCEAILLAVKNGWDINGKGMFHQ